MNNKKIEGLLWVIAVLLIVVSMLYAPLQLTHAQAPEESWIVPGRRYYFPVQPPKVARYSRVHHTYPATDIFVPLGSTVVAVTSGLVNEVNRIDRWDKRTNLGADRGGLWVTIIGDDGVRYHTSHLSTIEAVIQPGVQVYAGQIIGRSGKTGNAASTPPHVHFGISRPTVAGDWSVRRGQVWPFK
ncbi:MAG: M23 family metallopeptidase, partial [Anaerolineae bacterium]|nr:M23 family metallopeptidase [Anaerolineae bacterium]